MTLLAFFLVRLPQGNLNQYLPTERIDSAGTLHLAWLFGKRLWIAQEIAKVSKPTGSNLRKQGKTIVGRFVQADEEGAGVDMAGTQLPLLERTATEGPESDEP